MLAVFRRATPRITPSETDAAIDLATASSPWRKGSTPWGRALDRYQMTKSRIAASASIDCVILMVFGWFIEAGIKWAAGLLFAKLGGGV